MSAERNKQVHKMTRRMVEYFKPFWAPLSKEEEKTQYITGKQFVRAYRNLSTFNRKDAVRKIMTPLYESHGWDLWMVGRIDQLDACLREALMIRHETKIPDIFKY